MRRRTIAGLAAAAVAAVGAPVAAVAVTVSGRRRPADPALDTLGRLYLPRRGAGGVTELVDRGTGAVTATVTAGARTVLLAGPQRVFTDPSTTAQVRNRVRVRVGPSPWQAGYLDDRVWARWLTAAIGAAGDDVLATALRYVPGRPGDAGFGLQGSDGADFYDCLGVGWRFPDIGWRRPAPGFAGRLDCSGYVRLVYGYHHGIPLYGANSVAGMPDGLPRSAWAIAGRARSVTIAEGASDRAAPTDLGRVQPGDLVFFALHAATPHRITHSGICLGRDDAGRMRFVSSRKTGDGPTFGDAGHPSVIDAGLFGERLRKAVRL